MQLVLKKCPGCLSRDSKPSAWNDWPGCKHDGLGDQWWNEETVAWQQREWGLQCNGCEPRWMQEAWPVQSLSLIVIEPPWTSSLTQCARLNQYLPCFGKPSTLFSVCVPMYSIGFYHLKRCNTFLLVDIYLWLGFRQSSWAEKNSRSFRIDLLMLTVCTCGCQHEAGFMRDWIQRNFQSQWLKSCSSACSSFLHRMIEICWIRGELVSPWSAHTTLCSKGIHGSNLPNSWRKRDGQHLWYRVASNGFRFFRDWHPFVGEKRRACFRSDSLGGDLTSRKSLKII